LERGLGAKNNDKLRRTGVAAVLLHDIGHGAFSHASEKIFDFHHEDLSIQIIKQEMADILKAADISVNDVVAIITKTAKGKKKLLSQLISSQLDVDRLDYLARDLYFTGVGFGSIDLERIIKTMTVYDEPGFLKGYAVIEEKSKQSIESYLLTRTLMYEGVYYHKTTRGVEVLLSGVFNRVKELADAERMELPEELNFVRKRRSGKKLVSSVDLDKIISFDDTTAYALVQKWSKHSRDKILKDLSRRVLQRDLFKSIEYNSDRIQDFLSKMAKVQQLTKTKVKLDPTYYTIMDEPKDRPYQPVGLPTNKEEIQDALKKNIYVKMRGGQGHKELSEISEVVNALTKHKPLVRLYFPKEIREEANNIFWNP
jgi:HD superfamily phosphohydrolase